MELKDVEKAQKGDKYAFERIIMIIIDDLYKVSKGILKNEEDACDAVSSTVLNAYEKLNTLRNLKFFKTWVIKILINECNAIIRQNKKVVYIENYTENQEESYSNDNEISMDIQKTMENLDVNLKQIVILYYFQDLSTEEIANILEIPKGTVKSRLSRARQILAQQLIPGYKEDII